MNILTDVDGVLLNWEDTFHKWMAARGHEVKHKNSYKIEDGYDGISADEMHSLIETFNASAAMGFLPAIAGAANWVEKMYFDQGVRFTCITSMGTDRNAQQLRVWNLNRIFGSDVFNEVIILPCGADKANALEHYRDSGAVWLEDHIHNAVTGSKLGLNTFLFNRSYNQDTTKDAWYTRVNDWADLYKHLFDK